TDVIYLDFAKAFDSVDHKILLAKLKAYGISGQLLSWLTDYLSGRFQRVVLEGASSQWAPVTSGVPQGSLLGPLLFVIFINDLPDVAEEGVNTALYPDDTKIFGAVKNGNDCETIQTTLSNMAEWTQVNNIDFNASKCKTLTVTRKKQPLEHNYCLNNKQLDRVSEEKDLGITVTSTLSWDKHVHAIVSKANKLLGLLKRTCPLLTKPAVRRTLYLSLVKSQLCFGSQVWSPCHIYLQGKIERVQRRATRWILQTRVGEMTYKERLVKPDLLPLVYDRELSDLTFFFTNVFTNGRTRQGNSYNLKTPYFNRIVKLWNFNL
ncbi:RNA-directed DNA polymerase from mobile element jockey, partial [Exaiptasia diaphana]